ncbi:hypothetical protein PISL3812_00862 [Talaromyces islandicus]|uniref:Uncharacterized protein n=1 Tax=Talaromyces islandicus TaxID=28573 RepID=A0A0U1LN05_TALIS|nr:hypothetical protein PISL3812_00862 [Talaromyces islandicus]
MEKPPMPATLPAEPEPISPATMTNTTLCNSINSDVSLVKDPEFWRRFSMAVHRDEELAKTVTEEPQTQDSWLVRQRKKTRRSKIWGFLIALVIVLIAAGAAVAIWYLSKKGWFRKHQKP